MENRIINFTKMMNDEEWVSVDPVKKLILYDNTPHRLEVRSQTPSLAKFVAVNTGAKCTMYFYNLKSKVAGQDIDIHPDHAKAITILCPEFIGVYFKIS